MNYLTEDWREVVKRLEEGKAHMLDALCGPLDEIKTAFLRGQIHALNQILQWPQKDEEAKQDALNQESIEFL